MEGAGPPRSTQRGRAVPGPRPAVWYPGRVDRDLLRRRAEEALCAATGARQVVRVCPSCGSHAHGRPVALGTDAHVSLAYAGGLAVVAWSYAGPVGVDVERTGPPVDGVGDRAAWTRVEALLKATGEGIGRWPDVALPESPTLPTVPLRLPPGYVGTLAGTDLGWRAVTTARGAPAARGGPATP